MVYLKGSTLAVILSIISICNLAVYTKEVVSETKDSVKIKKRVLPSNLSAPDVNLADFMPMDATQRSDAPCTPGMTCGFQHFKRVDGDYAFFPFLPYCVCADYQVCVEKGVNNYGCFFIYKCENVTELIDTTTATGTKNASEVPGLGVSASSMVPQNAATESGQPVTFDFGQGPFPPSMNC